MSVERPGISPESQPTPPSGIYGSQLSDTEKVEKAKQMLDDKVGVLQELNRPIGPPPSDFPRATGLYASFISFVIYFSIQCGSKIDDPNSFIRSFLANCGIDVQEKRHAESPFSKPGVQEAFKKALEEPVTPATAKETVLTDEQARAELGVIMASLVI